MKSIITRTIPCLLIMLIMPWMLDGQSIDPEHLEGLKFRNLGPAGMSGRITAIDVNLRDKDHIYVGAASGGVWESNNGGITWKPIFDDQPTLSIGSIEINQNNPSEIWVGTGEGNPRNSHNSGMGVYKSVDAGKSWKSMGLEETKLIHRVVVNAHNGDDVLVGAMGSAWGPSRHRGVYRSKDGGKTWKQTLYVGDNVGVADMVADPSNPNKIIAAMWEFGRTPYDFNSGGPGSGLYISYDGGDNWKKLTTEEGLPKGDLGRMGISFAASQPNIVYALIEAEKNGLYKSTDGGEKWKLVSNKDVGNRPFYYCEIHVDPNNHNTIYNLWSYVSKSEDGGRTFKTIADYSNNIHPDHHAFWIDPDDSNYLIDGNDGGLNISRDGSKTWRFIGNLPVGQFYHVAIDNDFPYNVYGGMQDNGSWVGPGFALKRGGITNYDWQELYFGDGFDVAARPDDNRYGYAMSQGGYLGHWDKETGYTEFIQPQHPEGEELRYNWNAALALDPFNESGLYYGSQYVHHSPDRGKSWNILSPDLTTNDKKKQDQSKSGGLTLDITGAENYTTILCLAPSPHDKDEIWVGSDDGRLHVTRNGGDSWTDVSSKLPSLPKNAWIPQIEISQSNKKEIFVVVNNYRQNDWSAYLYHTTDGGVTWKRIVDDGDVPSFVCSVIQDPKHDDLIFLGTDVGLYYSLDHGMNWQHFKKAMPPVQIRDMKIQTRFDDLVLGTFGRAFWVLDDIEPLRELSRSGAQLLKEEFVVFEPGTAYLTESRSYQGVRFIGQGEFKGNNKPRGALFTVWKQPKDKNKKAKADKDKKAKADEKKGDKNGDKKGGKKKDKVKVIVIDENQDTIRTFDRKIKDGMNRLSWRPDRKGVDYPRKKDPKEKREPGGMPILPGTYKVVFEYGKHKDSTLLDVALDPRIDASIVDTEKKYAEMKNFNEKVTAVTKAFNNLKEAKKSVDLHKKLFDIKEDSLKQDIAKLQKAEVTKIDSLMEMYMLPEPDKPEYRDDAHTLNSQMWAARRFLGTSLDGPTKNGQHAIKRAEKKADAVLEAVNKYFSEDWKTYLGQIRNLPLDVFKEFEEVKIE